MQGRLLQTGYLDGAANMAIDEMLLMNSRHLLGERYQAILRLYGWTNPTLSLGYFQPTPVIMNQLRQSAEAEGFPFEVVRRLTGGATILHDLELTYSFVISEDNPLVKGEVTESYRTICRGIVRGLESLGIEAEFFRAPDESAEKAYAPKSNFCFANHSKYDVVFKGKKLVGSAQRRKNGFILQHGAILLDIDHQKTAYLNNQEINCFWEAVSLKDILGWRPDFDEAGRLVARGFHLAMGIDFTEEGLTLEEAELAEEIKRNKYSTLNWTNRVGAKR
ncbi:MAG: lipoate--protein ligase family protein [bacterium]